jgi:hypothetical protein
MAVGSTTDRWWGEQAFALDETIHWRLGTTEMWITRGTHEWRCSRRTIAEAGDAAPVRRRGVSVPDLPDLVVERLAVRQTAASLRMVPVLADRSLVVHPEHPVRLPRGEEIVLYVSTPLWLRLETVASGADFVEFPLQRPSDTWFGPSTMQGELCYASRTAARLNPDNVLHRPHRAVSALTVVNRSPVQFLLQKIKLPVPGMSLFATPGGRLWTERITLEHREASGQAALQQGGRPPGDLGDVELLSGPRVRPQRNMLIRAFGGQGFEGEGS